MDKDSYLPPVSKRSKQFTTLNGVGHRERMRSKLLFRGEKALEDYELLEMLLYLIIPRKDTKPIAKDLINKFGSLSKILMASTDQLKKNDVSDKLIVLIQLVNIIKNRLLRPDIIHHSYIHSLNDLLIYLHHAPTNQNKQKNNYLRILFFNNKRQLIKDEYFFYNEIDVISSILKKSFNNICHEYDYNLFY